MPTLIMVGWLGLLVPFASMVNGSAPSFDQFTASASVTQLMQPASGPGGTAYPFTGVQTERIGSRPSGATVFEPDGIEPATRPELPVIVFLHGFTAVEPQRYGGWIEHVVRRGAVVIYPDYQDAGVFAGGQDRYIDNMFAGISNAFDTLDLEPSRVHVVGHSLGAVLTMVYGTLGPERGLPAAASLTLIAPGGCRSCGNGFGFGVPVELDRRLPQDTLVSIVVGEDDELVGSADAVVLARLTGDIPADQQRFVLVRSDAHGQPPLVADHLFPQTAGDGGEEDALDWYGLWRPFDALVNCAESGQECDTALGTSNAALSMGSWSDGTPVVRPVALDRSGPG
ncbi:MAG: hypothetical protein M3457_07865 [Chloroflexota bacterium]|nr:hypothetical protein [Chloroflexota bacterium]